MKKNKAIVLLSGGLDSATTLYIARARRYNCHCLMFNYGQKHLKKELSSAIAIARRVDANFTILKTFFPWNKSALIAKGGPEIKDAGHHKEGTFPNTYVPGRNTIFISYALSMAETIGAERIFIGANAVDFSGYPDCRPEYFRAWNQLLLSLGTKIKIETPLLYLKKSEIIKWGTTLGVPYELTWSCYRGYKNACGKCDSCTIRLRGFAEAGIKDPIPYQQQKINL